MKRITLFLFMLFVTIITFGQTTYKTDLILQKTAPYLHLNGVGGYINFYNSDITLTQSSNTLTLAGGVLALPLNGLTLNSVNITATGTEINYLSGATSNIQTQLNDSLNGSTLYPELTDTIPLVTFGAGAGLTADTALFNNNVLIGSFYNEGSDTLVITQLAAWIKAGTGTETIAVQIAWHATPLSGAATLLNAAALTITDHTAMTFDVAFAASKIPPDVCVWGILSGASSGNKPTFLSVTLSGYKIPKY